MAEEFSERCVRHRPEPSSASRQSREAPSPGLGRRLALRGLATAPGIRRSALRAAWGRKRSCQALDLLPSLGEGVGEADG